MMNKRPYLVDWMRHSRIAAALPTFARQRLPGFRLALFHPAQACARPHYQSIRPPPRLRCRPASLSVRSGTQSAPICARPHYQSIRPPPRLRCRPASLSVRSGTQSAPIACKISLLVRGVRQRFLQAGETGNRYGAHMRQKPVLPPQRYVSAGLS